MLSPAVANDRAIRNVGCRSFCTSAIQSPSKDDAAGAVTTVGCAGSTRGHRTYAAPAAATRHTAAMRGAR
jgi:hypothetical protein